MARSVKKAPYVQEALVKKVGQQNSAGSKKVIKTWSRSSTALPDFVGHTFAAPTGNKFVPVSVTDTVVGHRLVDSSPPLLSGRHPGGKPVDKKASAPSKPAGG